MRKLRLASAGQRKQYKEHSNMQLQLEIPYSRTLLLPVEGSEAFIKYLEKGVMVSQDWRHDDKFRVEPERPILRLVHPTWEEVPEQPVEDNVKETTPSEDF